MVAKSSIRNFRSGVNNGLAAYPDEAHDGPNDLVLARQPVISREPENDTRPAADSARDKRN